MVEQLDFDHVDVGHELCPLRLTLTGEQVARYAHAARLQAGRFMSDDGARREGLPGQIAPGNMSLALFSRLIGQSFPGMRLRHLSATFRVPLQPRQRITVRGVVTEKHVSDQGSFLDCDLVLESEEGERWVTGTARVALPPPCTAASRG
ncbi:MAG: putative MaoC-like dehydratase [Deltaproteobacteria bacterium]|nr:putative MaoC-like dehydratase [Deltaproteobacteria bacterium]